MIKVPPLCRERTILHVFTVGTMVLLNPEMKTCSSISPLLNFEMEGAILTLRLQLGCSALPVRWMNLEFAVRAKHWQEQRKKEKKNNKQNKNP